MKCGLLGRKLGHSYSPQIHHYLGEYSYELFEKEPEELKDFLRHGDFTGINVTIPYKKDVIRYLDILSPAARKMGAVNTIVRRPDGALFGHNTDYFGFAAMVGHAGLNPAGKKVLVLGSGGASNTVVNVLRELGAEVVIISRKGENNYENLFLHRDASAIVNTTPVGMFPNTGIAPLDIRLFPHLEAVLDVVYNPARTQLLLDAEHLGIPTENGLGMLGAQAKEAAEYFTGGSIEDRQIATIHARLTAQMQNIVLIGMPGSGKSTIGNLLGQKLGRTFVDADETIVELAGKSIPEIFADDGEAVFRSWETEALSTLGKQSGLVIATGGGCVTQERNYPLLHQNGRIFWVTRDISKLPTQGRPLSEQHSLKEMYEKRKPMYQRFADDIISNDGTMEDTVNAILTCMEGNQ